VLFVSALPKTRSAKIVRRAVRAKALGTDPGDLSSLENPESLDEIAAAVA
jgi:acetyl-CoA synthetase